MLFLCLCNLGEEFGLEGNDLTATTKAEAPLQQPPKGHERSDL